MKRIAFLVTGLLSLSALQAQVKQGTIFYDQKVNMHKTIQDEQMKAMIPEFRTAKFMLFFSDSISMYKTVPEDEAPDPFAGGSGPRIIMRTGGPGGGGDLYKNFGEARSVQASEVGGKYYLITDSIRQQPWKLGTETKTILGYTCHKATRKVTQAAGAVRRIVMGGGAPDTTNQPRQQAREVEVVAWYAADIISPVGPENYGQLPGVILQLDVDNGTTVFTATEVKTTVDPKELKEPKKGKVMTRPEFSKMMMEMMNSGGGGFRIGG